VRPADETPATVAARIAAAHRTLEAMKARGLKPSPRTYSSLISLLGRAGDWEGALRTARTLGCDPDVHVFNAAISACARAGRFDEATDVLIDMDAINVRRDVVTYNILLATYPRAELPGVLRDMRARGIKPARMTYAIRIDGARDDPAAVLGILQELRDGPLGRPDKLVAAAARKAADALAASDAPAESVDDFRAKLREFGIAPSAPYSVPRRRRRNLQAVGGVSSGGAGRDDDDDADHEEMSSPLFDVGDHVDSSSAEQSGGSRAAVHAT